MKNNSEILCPTTGEVCPAKQQLHNLYVGNAGNPLVSDVIPGAMTYETSLRDETLYRARMVEYIMHTSANPCDGVSEAGECPIRLGMDNSPVRRGLVAAVRSAMGHSRA